MIAVGVVAHDKRRPQAEALAADVDADFLSVDDGTLGCNDNHRRVWAHLAATGTMWAICLEDDALPVPDFRHQAMQALTATPTDVVSFYLGTGRPVWFEMAGRGSAQKLQPLIREAIDHAETTGSSFITAPKLFHAVAVAIRTPLIPHMLKATEGTLKPIDFAIGDWCATHGHTVAYTMPSIVEHEDGPTVIRKHHDGEPRLQPRKAHRYGTRHTWTSKTVDIEDH